MTAEDFFVYDRGHRQAVKAVGEGLPQLDVVPPLAFIVEPVDTVDGGTLVVPTKQKEILRIFYLVGQ
jgi:hypothetical protein